MAYMKIFHADGEVQASGPPDTTNAVDVTLRADLEAHDAERLYILADDTYSIASVVVTPTGTTAAKWQLAPDDAAAEGVYEAVGDPLSLGTVGHDTKVYFWAKALSTDDEVPVNDVSVTLTAVGIAWAV